MPISDHPNYPTGHFTRVYEHLIKPACELAGFKSIRADEVASTNHIALDIIKKIIDSDLALCDLSSQNPNVLYELGVRQAFNKPVCLIKDGKTKRIFDIQGFRDVEYDESLRIDKIQDTVELLSETLTNTFKQKENEINSLVKLLGITPARIDQKTKISAETELVLSQLENIGKKLFELEKNQVHPNIFIRGARERNIRELESRENLNYGEKLKFQELINLKKGDKIISPRFGEGEVIQIEINEAKKSDSKGEFLFENGQKRLLLRFANLYKKL